MSLEIINDKKAHDLIDLTIVTSNDNVNKLNDSPKSYELEIDFSKKADKISSKYFNILENEILMMKKILQSKI